MASFTKYQGPKGVRHKAMIRRKGYPTESKTFATKKLAQSWAKERERDIEEGRALPNAVGRRKTLADLIDRHMLRDTGRDLSKVSRLAWWRKHLGDRPLSEVNHVALLDALERLRGETIKGGGTRTEATICRYLANLSVVLRDGVDEGWLVENPTRRIRRSPENNHRRRWLRDHEREALLTAVQDAEAPLWLYPLTVLALGTGARRGELFGLTWANVDLARGVAYLATTKNDEPRVLALLPPVLAVLKQWRGTQKVRQLNEDRVFPVGYFALDKPFAAALERACIEGFRFHDLRHSCASYLAQAGVPQRTIMEAMGHKSLQASQRYMHLSTEHVKAALEKAMEGKL